MKTRVTIPIGFPSFVVTMIVSALLECKRLTACVTVAFSSTLTNCPWTYVVTKEPRVLMLEWMYFLFD